MKPQASRPSATRTPKTISDLSDRKRMMRVNFELTPAEHLKLKIHAAKQFKSISDVMREFVLKLD